MPPYLDPKEAKLDGLAFLGLSLTRNSPAGHPDSITHQTAFDLNEVIDREYQNIMSSNDDGWLCGGGEPGPPDSYKLAAKDSSHVEIMRIGNYRPDWGGITEKDIVEVMRSGKILIPQIEVLPTAVVANPDHPPELEIRFDMEPWVPDEDWTEPLPINWQLRFIHNQLFEHFKFPCRFCPGPFHSTILRKAEWRSPEHKKAYFEKCNKTIEKWRQNGPQPLNSGAWDVDGSQLMDAPEHNSGIWLFLDRQNITHFFSPNFMPPYDNADKRKVIMEFITKVWHEPTLQFYPAGEEPGYKKDREGDANADDAVYSGGCLGIMQSEFLQNISEFKKRRFD